jgi:hypothetical protein
MPAPPPSPRKTPRAAPYQPIPLSPKLAGLQAMLYELAKSERMDQLVNYLHDLRQEFDWTAAELKTLGFCAPCYFSILDDGDAHDCPEEDR